MEKLYLILIIPILIIVMFNPCGAEYSNDEDRFPSNDHQTLFRDLNKAFALDTMFEGVNDYFQSNIRIGQSYTWKKFQQDWKGLKTLSEYLCFFHKLVWVGISQTSIRILKGIQSLQHFLLNYIKQKCDKYLGSNAQLHPWNIMMEQNQQNISFLVFVYGTALSLILIRLLSWLNFMVYMAICFLVYSFGGPHMVFKWLLCLTAFFWFLVDILLLYPLQTAIFIIALYVLSYLWRFLPSRRRTYSDVQDYYDSPPLRNNGRSYGNYSSRANDRRHVNDNSQKDLRLLTSRIDGMERKTDLLSDRLDRLSDAFERLNYRDFNTEDEGNEAEIDE